MKTTIISVGSELLNGMMVDTNSVYMAEELNRYGIKINAKIVAGDIIEDIVKAIEFADKNSDLVIMTGGLGPTIDDLTRDAIAQYLGKKLVLYDEELQKLKERFLAYKLEMPEKNIRQVMFPEESEIIENRKGTAPSFKVGKIAAFSGVPDELRDSFPRYCEKIAQEHNLKTTIYIKDILVWGVPESQLEAKIIDIIENEKEVFVEFLVKDYGIIIRLLVDEGKKSRADELKQKIYERVSENIFGEDSDRIENLLVEILAKNRMTFSTAESCTGGLIASKVVGVSGASRVFEKGYITYSNESKSELLGVNPETLKNHGAVSEETVFEMLKGLKSSSAIAISGIAGPEGGSEEKPVGTVFAGIKINDVYITEKMFIRGDRNKIRERAAMSAMFMLLTELKKHGL